MRKLSHTNKRKGGANVAKSLNVEVRIKVEGGIFWKKLIHRSLNMEGGFFLWRVKFFKIGKRDFTFIREMRV